MKAMYAPSTAPAAASPPVIAPGDIVRTTRAHAGMAAGSLGLFLGWCLSGRAAVVTFYNRGPKPIAGDALELVEHRRSFRGHEITPNSR
jgi:hypothetical protein